MISAFKLKFGRSKDAPSETIPVTPVTVFVGPNGSGKSRILQEIKSFGVLEDSNQRLLLDDCVFDTAIIPSAAESSAYLQQAGKLHIHSVRNQRSSSANIQYPGGSAGTSLEGIMQVLQNPANHRTDFWRYYLSNRTLVLDGLNRINLVADRQAGDLQARPENTLQSLFGDDTRRYEVRRIIHDAFGLYFVLDPTNIGNLRIRLSERPPVNDVEERGLDAKAVAFHGAAQLVASTSDGMKAFIGIITEVIAGDPELLLIDEPEAFLHPPLAFKLGLELARAAAKSPRKRIFVSTHSAQFVMGCIQAGVPVTIVRLTYRERVATARVLPSTEILGLMRNPLLRSTGLLNGLFYESMVVTEADTDRAFYNEINERLLAAKSPGSIANCLFVNAQNKQTLHTVVRPMRQLGIPTAAIVDIDVLKEGGKVWSDLLSAASVTPIDIASLGAARAALKTAMESTTKNMKTEGGTAILAPQDREAAENLIARLAEYGIFVVPSGEVESWLKHLGAAGHGPNWLTKVFELMGQDPNATSYVHPASDDVWNFMAAVGAWLVNPARKGIPA